MSFFDEMKVPKLTELQEYTYGDKLTMIATGQVPNEETGELEDGPVVSKLNEIATAAGEVKSEVDKKMEVFSFILRNINDIYSVTATYDTIETQWKNGNRVEAVYNPANGSRAVYGLQGFTTAIAASVDDASNPKAVFACIDATGQCPGDSAGIPYFTVAKDGTVEVGTMELGGGGATYTATAPLAISDANVVSINAGTKSDIGAVRAYADAPAFNVPDFHTWVENFKSPSGSVNWSYGSDSDYMHVEGYQFNSRTLNGNSLHVEGYADLRANSLGCTGTGAHVEGMNTQTLANAAHAEGSNTKATRIASHAEGIDTMASGNNSHAEGSGSTASGNSSHAEGSGSTAQRLSQHVFGEYNIADTEGTTTTRGAYVEIVGNGTSGTARSNARTLMWDGTQWNAGDVTCATEAGSSSNYSLRQIGAVTASVPSMEYGTSNSIQTISGSSTVNVDITFGSAKTEAPVVFTSLQCPSQGVQLVCTVQSVTNTQASLSITNLGTVDVQNVTVDWLALSGR